MVPKLPMRPVVRGGVDAWPLLRVVYLIIYVLVYYGLISRQPRITPYRYDNYRPGTCSPLLLLYFDNLFDPSRMIDDRRTIDRFFAISVSRDKL